MFCFQSGLLTAGFPLMLIRVFSKKFKKGKTLQNFFSS